MCRSLALLAFILSQVSITHACTTFQMSSFEKKIMGKSYDWHLTHGMVIVNKRNIAKTALTFNPLETPASWVSKYGTVTFNQYGREFPLGGINEKGLAVEIMWLDETQYPEKDSRKSLNELQWIQYQLDNYSKVIEVVKDAEKTG